MKNYLWSIPFIDKKSKKEKTVEKLQLALREIAEHGNLVGIEDELIRDIFIAKMYDQESQKELLKKTLDYKKEKEKAIAIETGNQNQAARGAERQSMISIVGGSEPNL